MDTFKVNIFNVSDNEMILYINGRRINKYDLQDNLSIAEIVTDVLKESTNKNVYVNFEDVDDESEIDEDDVNVDHPSADDPMSPIRDYIEDMLGENTDIDIKFISREDFENLRDDLEDPDDLPEGLFGPGDLDDTEDRPGSGRIPPNAGGIPPGLLHLLGLPFFFGDPDMDNMDDMDLPELPEEFPDFSDKRFGPKPATAQERFKEYKKKSTECVYIFNVNYKDSYDFKLFAVGEKFDVESNIQKYVEYTDMDNVNEYFKSLFSEYDEDINKEKLQALIKENCIQQVLGLNPVDEITEEIYKNSETLAELSINIKSNEQVTIN